MASQKISMRLLKKEVIPATALKKSYSVVSSQKTPEGSRLYTDDYGADQLDWASYLGIKAQLQGKRAVLFILENQRWYALFFSGGYHMMKLESCVDDFGLIVALNCLDPDKIKSSDVFIPLDHSKQKRTQTTKETNLEGHDFDGYTNILKNITGKTKPEYTGISKTITASSSASITLNTKLPASDLIALIKQLSDLYKKDDYIKNFPRGGTY